MIDDLFVHDQDDNASLAAEATQRALIDTREKAGMLLKALPVGLLIHTRQGILYANGEAARLLAMLPEQLRGLHLLDFVDAADLDQMAQQFDRTFDESSGLQTREVQMHAGAEGIRSIKVISARLVWDGNPVIQVILQDITELKRTETSLRRMTITDELTGAFNRRHAFYEAGLYVGNTPRIPLSALVLDVDHFKRINDTFGHAGGDAVLRSLVRIVTSVLKLQTRSDAAIFCRIGGEEFLALLPGIELDEAARIAERLRLAVRSLEVSSPTGPIRVSVSVGVGELEDADCGFDGLLRRCDDALYAAKHLGRNCVMTSPRTGLSQTLASAERLALGSCLT